jgi:hypothetical protein
VDQSRCVALWRCVLLGGAGIPRVVEVVVVWHKGEIGEREGKERTQRVYKHRGRAPPGNVAGGIYFVGRYHQTWVTRGVSGARNVRDARGPRAFPKAIACPQTFMGAKKRV